MTVRVRPKMSEVFVDKVNAFSLERRRRELSHAKLFGPSPELEQDPVALRKALEQLRFQHEELLVAEEELRAQLDELARMGTRVEAERARYVELFEHAPDAYLVTDLRGVVHDANAAAIEMFNLEFRFFRGKPLASLAARTDVSKLHLMLDALGDGPGDAHSLEIEVLPRGSEPIRVVARIARSAAQNDRALWTIRRLAAPATERTQSLERALRDSDDLLERERRARAELERANEAKDRFIAVLSHDLRSPLNAILGWVELLQREVLDGVARKRAYDTIERNANAQAALIEELLDISRMAADRFHLELQPLDFADLVERVVESTVPAASKVDITVSYDRPEQTCDILGDARRLEQIVTNLLANALKFTPSGGTIDIAMSVVDGHSVELSVRDDGKGIDATLLPRLFDLYTQERDYATTRNGLGLGLYIVKRLVQLHDGTVRAESDGKDKGAVFTIVFPFRRGVSDAPPRSSGVRPLGDLRGHRILVVDDEKDSRELVAAIVTRAGAGVQCAKDAASAEQLLASGAFDVVVSDIAMPEMDGYTLLGRLREQRPALAAIAVSGFASEADGERALSAGFDAYLTKPLTGAAIVEAIRSTIERRRA